MESKERSVILDILKIIATFIIVWHHYQQILELKFSKFNFFYGKFYFGWIVELFFVISGFLMYRYIEKIKKGLSFKEFYLKRVLRLIPLVGIVAIIYEITIYFYYKVFGVSFINQKLDFFGTFISIFGIQEGWVFVNPMINNPMWYISVLFLCYIIFYYITYKHQNLNIIYAYIAMILIGVGIRSYGIKLPFFNMQSARGYYAFFTGLLLSIYLNQYKVRTYIKISCLILFFLISLLILKDSNIVKKDINYILTFIYYPCIIVIGNFDIFKNINKLKFLSIFAEISYDVYVWHASMILLTLIIVEKLKLPINLYTHKSMFIFSVILFIWGTFSFYFIEKPLKKLIDKNLLNFKEVE